MIGALAVHGLAALLALGRHPARPDHPPETGVKLFALSIPAEPPRKPTAPAPPAEIRRGADSARDVASSMSPSATRQPSAVAMLAPPLPLASAATPPAPMALHPEVVQEPAPSRPDAPSRLAAYQKLLWERIAAHRPRGARMVGTVRIRFRLDRQGALVSAEVANSSGLMGLDRIALRTVRQASPFPAPPSDLAEALPDFEVPIEFR